MEQVPAFSRRLAGRPRERAGFTAFVSTGTAAGGVSNTLAQLTQPLTGHHGGALLRLDGAEHAIGQGYYLEADLVGLQLDQHIVALDRVTGLL